jgi:hypothetical protein
MFLCQVGARMHEKLIMIKAKRFSVGMAKYYYGKQHPPRVTPAMTLTRFAWWRQDLHAIELLRAHIGEWTINSDVGLLKGYVLYWLLIELEFMDLDTFSRSFGMHPNLCTSW